MSPMSARAVVEQLAREHDAHLRWLSARLQGRLACDEVEDVLQAAYARALTALSKPACERPRFERPDQATAWLRTIALNHARDVVRERHGRAGDRRVRRPAPVGLEDAACATLTADVDVEGEVIDALQRDAERRAVLEAVARLDDRHRQILQLRYGRDLPPAAIMVLVGLDRRQWDGRHTRALKAFSRALGRLGATRECRRTRSLLRDMPAALLGSARGPAAEHIGSCLSCAAFSRAVRHAMSTLPLPLAIEAWRFDAMEALAPWRAGDAEPAVAGTSRGPSVEAAPGGVSAGLGAAKLVASICATALAGLAIAIMPDRPSDARRPAAGPAPPSSALGASRTRLASHLTPRQTLERAARETGRRRAAAGGPPPTRVRATGARAAPGTAGTPRMRGPGDIRGAHGPDTRADRSGPAPR